MQLSEQKHFLCPVKHPQIRRCKQCNTTSSTIPFRSEGWKDAKAVQLLLTSFYSRINTFRWHYTQNLSFRRYLVLWHVKFILNLDNFIGVRDNLIAGKEYKETPFLKHSGLECCSEHWTGSKWTLSQHFSDVRFEYFKNSLPLMVEDNRRGKVMSRASCSLKATLQHMPQRCADGP